MVEIKGLYYDKCKKSYYLKCKVKGKVIKRSCRTDKLKIAIKRIPELIEVMKEVEYSFNDDVLISDLLNRYLEGRGDLQASSLGTQRRRIKGFINAYGDKRVRDINDDMVARVVSDMIKRGRAVKTINNLLSDLNVMFKWSVKNGLIGKIPFDINKHWLKYQSRDEINNWNINRIRKLIISIDEANISLKYKVIYYILIFSGLRISEVLGLRVKDIDLMNKRIYVNYKRTIDNERAVSILKSKRARRYAIMLGRLDEILSKYIETFESDDEFIFSEIRYNNVYNKKKSIERGAGFRFKLHHLRHIYTSMLVWGGLDVKKIQYYLGHESIKTTLDIYTHLNDTSLDAEVVNERLGLI
jgi:integrase